MTRFTYTTDGSLLLGKYETCLLGSCGFAHFLIVLSVRSKFARLWVCKKRRRKQAEKRPHYFSPSMETRCFLPLFSLSKVICRVIEVEEFTTSLMSWTCCRSEIKTCCLRKHVVWLLPVFAALNGLFVQPALRRRVSEVSWAESWTTSGRNLTAGQITT